MKNSIIIFSVILFFGCKRDHQYTLNEAGSKGDQRGVLLPVPDYVAYVESPQNGLSVVKEIDDMVYTLQYKPLEYVVALEKLQDTISKTAMEKRISELKDMQYFTLKMEAKNNYTELLKYKLQSQEEYYERVEYFSFLMQKEVYLKEGKDSIPCALFHFERNYGIAPYIKLLLGFPLSSDQAAADKTVSFNDQVFKGGKINIRIENSNVNNIPHIKTY
jgi:hypothetical protein